MQPYTVHLDAFEGPLDLLLHLIRRAELDITEISLSSVTDQYLHHIEHLASVDVEAAGEFLVVAATLIEIKSRLVNPDTSEEQTARTKREESDELNPAAELLRQLLEYRSFREAGDALETRREDWDKRYPSGRAAADKQALKQAVAKPEGEDLDMDELDLYQLVAAFQKIIETIQFDRLGEHSVLDDDTPIELHAADLIDRLKRETSIDEATGERSSFSLRSLFQGRKKPEVIGLFLATLELVKQGAVAAYQDRIHGEIVLKLTDDHLGDEVVSGLAVDYR
ncbi:MAG: segregation and condensation protein A [Phycisphaerales bacterium JB065]